MCTLPLAVIIVAFLVMRNCSGGGSKYEKFEQKVELTPNESKVKGYLSGILEVVDGTYTFDYKGSSYTGDGKIQVKIKSIGKGDPNDYGLNDGNHGPLYLTICDKNGTPSTDFTDVESEYTSDGILKDMMTTNSENWISFKIGTYGGKKVPETAATFFVTSKKIEKREYSSSSDSSSSDTDTDSDSESVSSSDSQDWDKVLDDYEAYVDKMLKVMKKLKNDDLSVMTEYPAMMEKAKDLEDSLKKAQKGKSLSSKQINRKLLPLKVFIRGVTIIIGISEHYLDVFDKFTDHIWFVLTSGVCCLVQILDEIIVKINSYIIHLQFYLPIGAIPFYCTLSGEIITDGSRY